MKCDSCDSFTHKKRACLDESSEKYQFYCKVCNHTVSHENSSGGSSTNETSCILKLDNGYKCAKCVLVVKSNYGMKRHVERKHQAEDSATIETQKRDGGKYCTFQSCLYL